MCRKGVDRQQVSVLVLLQLMLVMMRLVMMLLGMATVMVMMVMWLVRRMMLLLLLLLLRMMMMGMVSSAADDTVGGTVRGQLVESAGVGRFGYFCRSQLHAVLVVGQIGTHRDCRMRLLYRRGEVGAYFAWNLNVKRYPFC